MHEYISAYCLGSDFVIDWSPIQGKVKIKQSHYRPGQALSVSGACGSQISRQSAYEGGKVVSHTHRPPLPLGNIPYTHFWVDPRVLVWPEGLCEWKIPVTPSGIKSATFRFVAQCLNQLHHRVPPIQENLPYYFDTNIPSVVPSGRAV
jgi:hypothetical protein